jgi:UDP-N-acetylglucosamine diphosphorylase/glucosamine-1-phosphate N-acetyltransferase
MKIQLSDNDKRLNFAPLTLTRPVGDLRVGILTNEERWQRLVPDCSITFDTTEYLRSSYSDDSGDIVINACVLPDRKLAQAILELKVNEKLSWQGEWLAKKGSGDVIVQYQEEPLILHERWDIYQKNGAAITLDFGLLTSGRTSTQLSSTNTIIGDPGMIFLEEGAKVEAAILNASNGPIYIGKNAEIMEGSIVRGPLAMMDSSVLKLGAKIYGPTTLGPHCKVGGEVNNCVFQAYSNKGHDGFLGNSLIGAWCNIGADSNTSNLKNNYSTVRTYSFNEEALVQTDVQFMGLAMGDHSKCGINTMFNTASVVGVSCNVFGSGFPDKYLPSFSWGNEGDRFDFEKALIGMNNMMERRGLQLSEGEKTILRYIFDSK